MALFAGAFVVASPGVAAALGTLSASASGGSGSVQAGAPWVFTGAVTNTGLTTVTGITTIGSTSRGHITAIDAPCQINNVGADNATGYSILVCPDPASFPAGFDLPGGATVSAHVTLDTTGLAGQSITYTGHASSPDIPGGRTPDVTATVDVTDPGPTVSITSPNDGQLLDNSNDTTFSADAQPGFGQSVVGVDFSVDGESIGTDFDAPYEATIPVHSLADGPHTLEATVTDSGEGSASDSITVTQGVEPTVTITSPSEGDTLDTGTATTFQATATPGTGASVTSVDFSVDAVVVASIATPSSPNTYQTSIPPNSLTAGPHVLSVQVNDSAGSFSSDTINVTQPATVGPIVTIKPPLSFTPWFFDAPQTFKTTTTLQSGDVVQSVVWDSDGTVLAGASTLKPYAITIDPQTLGAGTHSLNVTVTSAHGVGSDSLTVTVPPATLTLDDATPGDNTIDPLSAQFVPGPDATADAAWVVPVANTGTGTARSVTLDLAASDGSNGLTFDLAQMSGCAAATVFESLAGASCSLGDIAPGTTRFVSVRIPTNGVTSGTQFVGLAQLHSSNADLPGTSVLAATQAIIPAPVLDDFGVQIAAPDAIGIVTSLSTQTQTFVNTIEPVGEFNQLLVKVISPHRVLSTTLAPSSFLSLARFSLFATVTAPKPVAPPPLVLTLGAGDPDDPAICPPAHPCKGLPARVIGDFGHYNDRAHPIKVTISSFLKGAVAPNPTRGIVGTVGDVYFVGSDGTFQLTGLTGHAVCARNPATKQYATPCHLGNPKYKTVLDANKHSIGVIATDTILFVGGDPTINRH